MSYFCHSFASCCLLFLFLLLLLWLVVFCLVAVRFFFGGFFAFFLSLIVSKYFSFYPPPSYVSFWRNSRSCPLWGLPPPLRYFLHEHTSLSMYVAYIVGTFAISVFSSGSWWHVFLPAVVIGIFLWTARYLGRCGIFDGQSGSFDVQEVVFPLELAQDLRLDDPGRYLFQRFPAAAHLEVGVHAWHRWFGWLNLFG